uniref:Morc S5 domain-containing protein n=1 Tax=Vitis vinifera TaxID=29760 RepID=F6GYW8_VITVI
MRIIIYNLWEDDSGQLELDFDTDQQDIHIRGVNRDEKNIQMAKQFPNSRHFLTYRHSLRPMIHHNVPSLVLIACHCVIKWLLLLLLDSSRMQGTILMFKGSMSITRIDSLRLPFWRLWNAAGSDGRGVIGVLEADFVEPAHDKQGFERTIVLSRLETRLQQMQKTYWTTYCHKIGYAPRGNKKLINESVRETPPDHLPKTSSLLKMKVSASSSSKTPQASHSNQKQGGGELERTPETVDQGYGNGNGHSFSKQEKTTNMSTQLRRDQSSLDYELKERCVILSMRQMYCFSLHTYTNKSLSSISFSSIFCLCRLKRKEGDIVVALQHDLEKERGKCRLLETQLQEAIQTIEERNKEQDSLIETFSEERERRDIEEANLRKKLKVSLSLYSSHFSFIIKLDILSA